MRHLRVGISVPGQNSAVGIFCFLVLSESPARDAFRKKIVLFTIGEKP